MNFKKISKFFLFPIILLPTLFSFSCGSNKDKGDETYSFAFGNWYIDIPETMVDKCEFKVSQDFSKEIKDDRKDYISIQLPSLLNEEYKNKIGITNHMITKDVSFNIKAIDKETKKEVKKWKVKCVHLPHKCDIEDGSNHLENKKYHINFTIKNNTFPKDMRFIVKCKISHSNMDQFDHLPTREYKIENEDDNGIQIIVNLDDVDINNDNSLLIVEIIYLGNKDLNLILHKGQFSIK